MLLVNNLIGFGGGGAKTPVVVTKTAATGVTATASDPHTFSSVSIGSADASRIVVVACTLQATFADNQPLSCTIAGNTATALTLGGSPTNAIHTRIFYLAVPTGTTANIAIDFNANDAKDVYITVYSVTGGKYLSQGTDTSTDMDATDPLTTGSVTIPDGGALIAVAACTQDNAAKTWTNATEDTDVDAGNQRHTSAVATTAGSTTVTCQGTTNGEDGVLSWAIFEPE